MIGVVIAILRVNFSQAEDMGIFLTVSGMVAHGYHLYSQIFDIKDPLFFYSAAASIRALGVRGPFVLDAFLIIISAPLAYLLGLLFRVKKWVALSSSIFFLLTLTGTYYQSFRTQIAAIDLVLLLTISCLLDKWYFGGLIFLTILGFKLPFGIFIVIPLIIILRSQNKNRNILRFGIGLASSGVLLALFMQLRGELLPYIRMNIENFKYQSGYQAIVGQRHGILGHLLVWNQGNGNVVYFVLGTFLFFVVVKKSSSENSLKLVSISVLICIFVFLAETAMWYHHLQILALAVPFMSYCVLQEFVDRSQSISIRKGTRTAENAEKLNPGFLIFLLIALLLHTGFQMPAQSTMSLNRWFHPQWYNPSEIAMLGSVQLPTDVPHTFARIGANDDSGFGAFLTQEWKFKCTRVAIGGYESQEVIDAFDNCLKSQVNFILVSPQFAGQSNRGGTYPYYLSQTNGLLNVYFSCNDLLHNGFRICTRKELLK
jgi:glycerol-3-phosphate acyltransferase PlsY